MRRLYFFLIAVAYSFPIQLFLNNLRRNHVLVLCWVILFAMITGAFGKYLGVPYLFLDPEYLNKVNFTSFFIIGFTLAGFTIAFHITCYITDGHRFTFVGTLTRPFTKFVINNSLIPGLFLILYISQIIAFQINNQYSTAGTLRMHLGGLLTGYVIMTLLLFVYFWFTNKDIFRYVVCQIDEKLKQKVQVTRASAMMKLDIARKKQVRVDNYIDHTLKIKKVEDHGFYDRATIIQVFDQNHLNLVIIEGVILLVVVILGIFKDYPTFQLPAAASFIIFLSIFVMIAGAFSYWFGGWSTTSALIIFLVFNHLVGEDYFTRRYEAFGLDYNRQPVPYTIQNLRALNDSTTLKDDHQRAIHMLDNWRNKFPVDQDPKMVFLCVSGGGKRAALWAFNTLQTADSLTDGKLFRNSILITGASGGLIGASYFRELKLREFNGEDVSPYAAYHRDMISTDNLNPLIFSLLANDLFVGFTKFRYGGNLYVRDRGYTFEDQLNQITERLMDKPITEYREPEMNAQIPMMILTPTIVNDGRKLYIASQPVSFMNADVLSAQYEYSKFAGVDFQRLFEEHGAKNLRFLSALRMSATFPYITPNTSLPTEPVIQIMDAGISDNFGLSDAMRFMFAFKDWIEENTSGVILVSIRDSPKLGTITAKAGQTIVDDLTQPISSVYNNFENFQDINSDLVIAQARSWYGKSIDRIDLQYQTESYVPILQKMDSIRQNNARASLSWRLTRREKEGIIETIYSTNNLEQLQKLKELLE